MAVVTKPKRRTSPRALFEWSASAPSGAPLRIDRERRVIEGVRVLGRFSRNSHGLAEAENGTEYTPECMREALPLYEGAEVLSGHEQPGQRRASGGNDDVVGVLRNVRLEGSAGQECIRADLHYFETHKLVGRLIEDVERAIGVFGLSHDASAGRERFDRANKRLVIESLSAVRSVDLVRKPATNRNLWESHEGKPMPKTTLRELLEALRLTPARRKWRNRLLEMGDDMPGMDAPVDAPAPTEEPDDALWSGFMAAITKLCEKYKAGEMDYKQAGKAVMDYLKTHDKLSGSAEPDAPDEVQEEDEDDASDKKTDDDKTESVKSENAALKHKLAVRELCEQAKIAPDKALLESLEALPIANARALVEREKARGTGGAPRSSGAPKGGTGGKGGTKPRGEAFVNAITE